MSTFYDELYFLSNYIIAHVAAWSKKATVWRLETWFRVFESYCHQIIPITFLIEELSNLKNIACE